MISADSSLIACHLLQDASAILLWGACGYLLACVPPALSSVTLRRVGPLLGGAAVVLAVSTALALPVNAAFAGDGWGDALDSSTIRAVLFETSIGPVWCAQAILASLILLFTRLRAQGTGLVALCAGLFLSCHIFFGHAVRLQGAAGWYLQASYLLHVLSVGAWLGALVPFIAILRQAGSQLQDDFVLAMRRFSTVGHFVVGLIIFTGLLNAWLIHGRLWPVWSSQYDQLLAAKVLVVSCMVMIAIYNRYVVVPSLKREGSSRQVLIWLSCTEVAMGSLALVLVSLFSAFDPA